MAATGCTSEDLTALGDEGRYDRSALDLYLTDVAHPAVDVSVSNTGSYENFYGDWEAKIDMKAELAKEREKRKNDPNYDPTAEKFGEAFAEGMADMMSFALSIKKDKTFTMTVMFFPIEGKWTQKGDQLFLQPETVMGMSKEEMAKMGGENGKVTMKNEEPLILKISTDGQTLTAINPKDVSGSDELVFKRKVA